MRALVGCALALLLGAPVSSARPNKPGKPAVKRPPYTLTLDAGWRRLPIDTTAPTVLATQVLDAHGHDTSGRTLVVTKTAFPNFDAKRSPAAYMNSLEVGLRAVPGYKRVRRTQRTIARVPVVDYVFQRRLGGTAQVVMMRFLLYRSWSYAVTLTTPAASWPRLRRDNERTIAKFRPR